MQKEKNNTAESFPVVGIGASAGGMKALFTFFDHVPENTGIAYVLILQLSTAYESRPAKGLEAHTSMPVIQVRETTTLEADHVYLIPPGANPSVVNNELRLAEIDTQLYRRAPIDHFFFSLAQGPGSAVVGILLAGTGSDGAWGLKKIKERGGLTIAEELKDTEYDLMLQNGIATGMVDKVLPAAQIPEAVLHFFGTKPHLSDLRNEQPLVAKEKGFLEKVRALVQQHTGRDFSHYKPSTLLRRIRHQMQLAQTEDPETFLSKLRREPLEVAKLSQNFFITVTEFFRDREVFEALEQNIIPQLFKRKQAFETIRVWSAGCATGEEAYSLAMLLLEEAGRHKAPPGIQIFATDAHPQMLAYARSGLYADAIESRLSPRFLKRFFIKEKNGYRVKKQLRDIIVFSQHDLLSDPPFLHIDLLACRHLLIYLQPKWQQKLSELFHFALHADGFLLLGKVETMTEKLFKGDSSKPGIYQKVHQPEMHRPPTLPQFSSNAQRKKQTLDQQQFSLSYSQLHKKVMLEDGPPSILIDSDHNILHLSESAGIYLLHPKGEITAGIQRLIRTELRQALYAGIFQVKKTKKVTRLSPPAFEVDGKTNKVILEIRPVKEPDLEGCLLLLFLELEEPEFLSSSLSENSPSSESTSPADKADNLVKEFHLGKRRIHHWLEAKNTKQEELQFLSEELISRNEDLRGLMEEMAMSKEELQSMNTELHAANEENQRKVRELNRLNADLQNLMQATDIASLFLDRQLCIRRYTPKAASLFKIRPADFGRPLRELNHRLDYEQIMEDIQKVIDHSKTIEREVQDEENHWYLTRLTPYQGQEKRMEGVVLTLVDITRRKESEESLRRLNITLEERVEQRTRELRKQEEQFLSFAHTAPAMLYVKNSAGKCTFLSRAWSHFTGQKEKEGFDHGWMKVVHPDDRESVRRRFLEANERAEPFQIDYRLRHHDGSYRWVVDVGQPLYEGDRKFNGYVGSVIDIHDRKEAEEALRKNEQRFRAMADNLPLMVWLHDAKGKQEFVNLTFCQYFGVSREEMRRDRWQLLIHPEDSSAYLEEFNSSVQERRPFHAQVRVKNAEGEWRWLESWGRPRFDFDGNYLGFIGTSADISERKQAQQLLQESEKRYRTLFNSIDEGFCVIEMLLDDEGKPVDYRWLETNPAFVRHTGLKDAVGKVAKELVPDLEEHWVDIYGHVALTGEPTRFTEASPAMGRWFEVEAFRVGEPWQRRVGLLFTDITARKEVEEALRQNQQQLQAILEQMPFGISIAEAPSGRLIGHNKEAIRILGHEMMPADSYQGYSGYGATHKDGTPYAAEEYPITRALHGEHIYQEEMTYRRGDGTLTTLSVSAAPIRNEKDEIIRAVSSFQDISAAKNVEENLRKAKEAAEEAARAKEDFLAHMSHEIRTPLNAIVGLSNLLLKQQPKPSQKKNLLTLYSAAENLRELVNNILDFSKLEAGEMVIEEWDVHLNQLLQQVEETHRVRASEKGIDLQIKLDERIPDVVCTNQIQLSQVLNNLVSNAVKFTKSGAVTVEATLHREEAERLWIDFAVTDTGRGIPAGARESIFDRFTQLETNRIVETGGTGLGLSITKLLLQLLGSSIELESEVGKGSRFFFTLPVKRSKEGTGTAATENEAVDLSRLHLLLVEDVADNRDVFVQFLEGLWHIKVDTAVNGKEAVEKAKTHRYDLILMDIRMPVMDGYEAAEAIRNLPDKERAEIPIIALSAHTADIVKRNPKAHLFSNVLSKPFEPEELQQVLGEVTR